AGRTPEAKQLLVAHSGPGNVRELRNVVERAAILCDGGPIAPQHLALNPAFITPLSPTTNLPAAERRAIEQELRETDGNKAKAARRLGLTRTQLYVRLRKHRLEGLGASQLWLRIARTGRPCPHHRSPPLHSQCCNRSPSPGSCCPAGSRSSESSA